MVGAQNFTDPDVLAMLMIGTIVMLIAMIVAAGDLGKRNKTAAGEAADTL